MKTLKLPTEPRFPLCINRTPKVRDAWVRQGRTAFKAFWRGGNLIAHMTAPPVVVKEGRKKLLKIEAVPIQPIAEVWDSTGALCRLWFKIGEATYEAAKMNGWNPKVSEVPNHSELIRASDDAYKIAAMCAAKL